MANIQQCPVKDCNFPTNPDALDKEDVTVTELEKHLGDKHPVVKKAMRRVCYCGHPLPTSGGTCIAGHVLGISLKCLEEKCKFATKAVHMNLLSLADRRLANPYGCI